MAGTRGRRPGVGIAGRVARRPAPARNCSTGSLSRATCSRADFGKAEEYSRAARRIDASGTLSYSQAPKWLLYWGFH